MQTELSPVQVDTNALWKQFANEMSLGADTAGLQKQVDSLSQQVQSLLAAVNTTGIATTVTSPATMWVGTPATYGTNTILTPTPGVTSQTQTTIDDLIRFLANPQAAQTTVASPQHVVSEPPKVCPACKSVDCSPCEDCKLPDCECKYCEDCVQCQLVCKPCDNGCTGCECDCCSKCEATADNCDCCTVCEEKIDDCNCCPQDCGVTDAQECDECHERCCDCTICGDCDEHCGDCEICDSKGCECTKCPECEDHDCKACEYCELYACDEDCVCCQACGEDDCEECGSCMRMLCECTCEELTVDLDGPQGACLVKIIPSDPNCEHCMALSLAGAGTPKHQHMINHKTDVPNTFLATCNKCHLFWIQDKTGWHTAEFNKEGDFAIKAAKEAEEKPTQSLPVRLLNSIPILNQIPQMSMGTTLLLGAAAGAAGISMAPAALRALPFLRDSGLLPEEATKLLESKEGQIVINLLSKQQPQLPAGQPAQPQAQVPPGYYPQPIGYTAQGQPIYPQYQYPPQHPYPPQHQYPQHGQPHPQPFTPPTAPPQPVTPAMTPEIITDPTFDFTEVFDKDGNSLGLVQVPRTMAPPSKPTA